jgi:hypothetical protein
MIFTALDATDVLKVYAEQVIQQQETIGVCLLDFYKNPSGGASARLEEEFERYRDCWIEGLEAAAREIQRQVEKQVDDAEGTRVGGHMSINEARRIAGREEGEQSDADQRAVAVLRAREAEKMRQ